ncbi:MAG: IS3 family transposase [Leptospiraceae bacterium]|nr:IS3 family transposase [Leptospiraceae bacterium]
MIKRKNFSNEFKEKIVLEYTSGQSSAAQIALELGLSSYYYSSDFKERKRERDSKIVKKIESIIELLPLSGYRSCASKLKETMQIGRNRVQRLMRENQLNCRAKKAYYSGSTNSKHHLRKYSNLLIEADIQEYPVIVGDVT